MSDFIKVCPECKSTNIISRYNQGGERWRCMTCGAEFPAPLELMEKEIKD